MKAQTIVVRTLAAARVAALACAPLVSMAAVAPGEGLRPTLPVALANAGFESEAPGKLGAPPGWWAAQHAGPPSYVFTLDTVNPRSGLRSLKVQNTGPEPFGSIYQSIPAAPYRGKTLRFAAWIRTEGATGNRFGAGAGLTLHALKSGSPVAHVMMRKDAVKGTTDWARHEVVLDVPPGAEHVEVGLNLYGPGIAWLDDAVLDVMATPAAEGLGKPLR